MDVQDDRRETTFEKLKNSKIISKLRGIKNIQIVVALIIIAVALIIYSNVISKTKTTSKSESLAASVMTDEELRLSNVLSSIDGAGDVSVMISKVGDSIVGVIVIAEGAKDISVRLRLLDATSTALGVDKSVINVYSKSS